MRLVKIYCILILIICTSCKERKQLQSDEELFISAVDLFENKEYFGANVLFEQLLNSKLDQVLVRNYLAQSYLESVNFNAMKIYSNPMFVASKVKKNSEDKRDVEELVSALLESIPESSPGTQLKFEKSAELFNFDSKNDEQKSMIHTMRFLYQGFLVLYYTRDLYYRCSEVKNLNSFKRQLEEFVKIITSDKFLNAKKVLFEIVSLVPHMSNKLGKVAKKIIKKGVFRFKINNKNYTFNIIDKQKGFDELIIKIVLDFIKSSLAKYDLNLKDLISTQGDIKNLLTLLISNENSELKQWVLERTKQEVSSIVREEIESQLEKEKQNSVNVVDDRYDKNIRKLDQDKEELTQETNRTKVLVEKLFSKSWDEFAKEIKK